MTTIAITPSNEGIVPFLQQLLSNPAWVSKIDIYKTTGDFSRFNLNSLQAIEDCEMNNVTSCTDFDDYLKKINADV